MEDKETLFLAREPGKFITTEEQEREIIMNVLNSNNVAWFVAEYNGEIVGAMFHRISKRI